MKYRYVGKTGLMVSRVCLGTMTFGNKEWGCDEKTSINLTHVFIEEGGNFIDTADLYSSGESEIITGKAIKDFRRDDIVLATKCWFRTSKTPTAKGLSRKHIIEACEASLKRLQTDYIDLYQIHGPDPHTPFEETMRTLDDLVRQGKVRYVGCSNLYAWQVLKANGISSCMNIEKLCCGQYLYNLIVRDVEREILPACSDQSMGFICWSPIGAGMLAGKYKKADSPDEGTRLAFTAMHSLPLYWHERGFRIAEELVKVAENVKKPPALVALAWILHDRRVTSVIVGARRADQLRENLLAGEWDLPRELWIKLDKVAEFEHGYPKLWMDATFPKTFGEEEF